MAVVAPGSRYSQRSNLLVVLLCVGFGVYCIYDGWISEGYQRRNINWLLSVEDVQDASGLASRLSRGTDSLASSLRLKLSTVGQGVVRDLATSSSASEKATALLVESLNILIRTNSLYDEKLFASVALGEQAQDFLAIKDANEKEVAILNRLLLMDAYPSHFVDSDWKQGTPTANLKFNRYWGPVGCAVIGLYFLISALRIPGMKVVADDKGLTISGQATIGYDSIKQIDKRYFEKEGYFVVGYGEGELLKQVKISDRKYDNVGALLDELVRRTGAVPADGESSGTGDDSKE